MSFTPQNNDSPSEVLQNSGPPSEETILDVKSGVFLLSTAIKNNVLYPEGNPIRANSITTFKNWLTNFLVVDEYFQLEVRKTTFLYKNVVVYQEFPPDQHFVFPLYRDGIKLLELHQDTPFSEIEYFIHLLIKFRVMKDDAEDDLVTALWEIGLTHLKYYTAESLWGGIGLQNEFNSFDLFVDDESYNPVGPDGPSKDISELFNSSQTPGLWDTSQLEMEDDGNGYSLDFSTVPEEKEDLWILTADEKIILSRLIASGETRNNAHDALRVIKDLFHTFISPLDHVPICNYISDVVQNSTSHDDLKYIIDYLKNLKNLVKNSFPGLAILLAKIVNSISSKDVLVPLFRSWGDDHKLSNDFITDIAIFMGSLPQKSTLVLVPLLPEIGNIHLRQTLLNVVATKVCQPGFEATTLVSNLDRQFIIGIIKVIRRKKLKAPQDLMENLSRHEFSDIREAAVKILVDTNVENVKRLLHLLNDPSPPIYKIICSALTQWSHPTAEKFLMNHLQTLHNKRAYHEEEYLMCYYRALGCCATGYSLDFLKYVLLKNAWKFRFNRTTVYHRQGAALALMLMADTQEAKPILNTARLNFFSTIRRAVVSGQRYLENDIHGK